MDSVCKTIFCRNIGWFTEEEQYKLGRSRVGIAGVGGVGGLLAERLIRLGVGGLKITDPGAFEESNFNRQFASSMVTLGKNKAEVVFSQLKEINLDAEIRYSDTGIMVERDASLFVVDCDMVVDEMDFGLFKESIFLQRAARHRGIHYLFASAIGFGALLVNFAPDGLTLEEYNKLPPDVDLSDPAELKVSLGRIVPIVPSYAANLATEDNIQKIMAGERPAPTSSIGAGLASILAANEVINVLLDRNNTVKAPQYIYIDLLDRQLTVGAVS